MPKILLIHGPNLNLLGKREPAIYGSKTAVDLYEELCAQYPVKITYIQSNKESDLVTIIQAANWQYDGVLINAGAFSHTSIAIADAIKSLTIPVINIHISNIEQRESFRHTDLLQAVCKGSIVGLGTDGYALALECLLDLIKP
jgi:3-dehydroquinate dehydratase-2